jgi:hypothetical protein
VSDEPPAPPADRLTDDEQFATVTIYGRLVMVYSRVTHGWSS